MEILQALNPEQKAAVLQTEGPVLILAGAGSGKTRVLTHKVAYLLQNRLAKPWEILAVTFTNKAAGEMKERIEKLVGGDLGHMWVGTFHSLFARILRRFADRIGCNENFAIYDRDDQERLMKEVLKEFPVSVSAAVCRKAVRRISDLKNRLRNPRTSTFIHELQIDLSALLEKYEAKMKANNALDFDDLLVKPLELMNRHQDVADIYRERFRYILVDEFQDTNIAQNELLKLLYSKHRNITVVGDDDQAIYGWRGAELENILRFETDYPGAKTFRLERNYRSTDLILSAAQSVIDHNLNRHPKTLWTEKKGEFKPLLFRAYNPRSEAEAVVSEIERLTENGVQTADIAILYRINAQSRAFEVALRERSIPYTIVGGLKFYQRKEIKDILAYLRLTVNPNDSVSLNRIINFPPRGIGASTLNTLADFARQRNLRTWDALAQLPDSDSVKPALKKKLADFRNLMEEIHSFARQKSFPELVDFILSRAGIIDFYLADGSEEAFARIQNLKEFKVAVEEYVKADPERNIDGFLQEVALVTDIDDWEKGNLISLMTLHSAKGLEFPAVFIVGMEEGLFPLIRDSEVNLEEERRLFYVGATRAMERLYFSYAFCRQNGMPSLPSTFLNEIPPERLAQDSGENRSPSLFSSYDDFKDSPTSGSTLFPSDENLPAQFHRGDRVLHAKFGEGMISASEGSGDNEKVMVYFQGFGAKKLLVKFAGLRKITE